MKFCQYCGAERNSKLKYCTNCGVKYADKKRNSKLILCLGFATIALLGVVLGIWLYCRSGQNILGAFGDEYELVWLPTRMVQRSTQLAASGIPDSYFEMEYDENGQIVKQLYFYPDYVSIDDDQYEEIYTTTIYEYEDELPSGMSVYRNGKLMGETLSVEKKNETVTLILGNNAGDFASYTYNDKGKCIEQVNYSDGKETGKYLRTYNENGDILTYELRIGGSMNSYRVWIYDTFGKLQRYNEFDYEGNLSSYTEYIYDPEGTLVRTETFSGTSFEMIDYTTFVYDEVGNLIEESEYDCNDMLKNKITRTYEQIKVRVDKESPINQFINKLFKKENENDDDHFIVSTTEPPQTVHVHRWRDATCVAPKTCDTCGTTEGEKLDHIWCDATCIQPVRCEACGTTKGDPLGHVWIPATFKTAKTCAVCNCTEGNPMDYRYVSVEAEVLAIREAYNTIESNKSAGYYRKIELRKGVDAYYDGNNGLACVVVYRGTDGIGSYS